MKELELVARSQWGLLTTAQILMHLTKMQLATAVKRGWLTSVYRGVYRISGAPVTWQQRILAAQFASGPDAVASHHSAARLHELRVPIVEMPHITRKASTSVKHKKHFDVHESNRSVDFIVLQGIRTTPLLRTIVDLAGKLNRGQLAFTVDEAVIGRKTTFVVIQYFLDSNDMHGVAGVRQLRDVLRDRLPIAEGFDRAIELKVLKAAAKAGLPSPVTQHRVLTKYGLYFIDVAWPQHFIGAEADGYTVHTASRKRHNEDRRRRNELETQGWRILNFTHDMSMAEVAEVLRANFRSLGLHNSPKDR